MADNPGIYGPTLPPHLLTKRDTDVEIEPRSSGPATSTDKDKSTLYGPVLPHNLYQNKKCEDNVATAHEEKSSSENPGMYGPALPPNLQSSGSRRNVYGPTLPPSMSPESKLTTNSSDDNDDEDDDDVIGPLPSSGNEKDLSELEAEINRRNIESRSTAMKDKLTGKKGEEKLEREEWMLELPPEMNKNFGLGPRTFRAKTVDLGDRSGWTDTPKDKAKKQEAKVEPKIINKPEKSKSEIALQQEVEEYNKAKRPMSLMEIHQQNLKKQKLDAGPSIRRPFDRDLDLSRSKNDPNAKTKFLQNSQKMAEKFQTGQFENKFL